MDVQGWSGSFSTSERPRLLFPSPANLRICFCSSGSFRCPSCCTTSVFQTAKHKGRETDYLLFLFLISWGFSLKYIQLIQNIMLVSVAQQSDSVIHTHTNIHSFPDCFPSEVIIKYCVWLPVLCSRSLLAICIIYNSESRTPNLSPLPHASTVF